MTTSTSPIHRSFLPMLAGAAIVVTMNGTAAYPTHARELRFAPSGTSSAKAATRRNSSEAMSPWATQPLADRIPEADPWLSSSMKAVESARESGRIDKELASQAESLVALFASIHKQNRPTLLIDEAGIANFAIARTDLYLHLTLDAKNEISWIIEGPFGDDDREAVYFDEGSLPVALISALA